MLNVARIRLCRLERRWSQDVLGKMIGQDQAYISRLERGAFDTVTVAILEKLADAFGVSMDWLCGRKEDARV